MREAGMMMRERGRGMRKGCAERQRGMGAQMGFHERLSSSLLKPSSTWNVPTLAYLAHLSESARLRASFVPSPSRFLPPEVNPLARSRSRSSLVFGRGSERGRGVMGASSSASESSCAAPATAADEPEDSALASGDEVERVKLGADGPGARLGDDEGTAERGVRRERSGPRAARALSSSEDEPEPDESRLGARAPSSSSLSLVPAMGEMVRSVGGKKDEADEVSGCEKRGDEGADDGRRGELSEGRTERPASAQRVSLHGSEVTLVVSTHRTSSWRAQDLGLGLLGR